MVTIQELVPLLRELVRTQHCQHEAFDAIEKLLRPEGLSLYWDDHKERWCVFPLQSTLQKEDLDERGKD